MKSIPFYSSLCLLVLFNLSFSSTYFVNQLHPQANNNNDGSLNSPWATIQHAAEIAVAGDTVFIRDGFYNEHIYIENSGNPTDGPIVFAAYQSESPVIDGSGVQESQNGVIIAQDYIIIKGLELQNWNDNGIWVESAAFFSISDCLIHDIVCGIGIATGSHDFEINRVTLHHFDLYGIDVSPVDGIDCYNGIFNDCIAHTARDPEQNVDGFALGHGTQHNFTFNNCITFDVYDGFDISSAQSVLNGCLAYNCGNGCYKLWQDQVKLVNCMGYNGNVTVVELDWDGNPGKVTLMNCTFHNSGSFTIWIENTADTLNMHNCIVAGGDNIGLAFEQPGVGNYQGDYNLFQNNNPNRAIAVAYTDEFTVDQVGDGTWSSYSGQDAHSLTAGADTDIFISPLNNDLHLSNSSPAVDSGTSTGAPSIDFDGITRPYGNGYDIGAYEFGNAVGIHSTTHPDRLALLQNYPNPFNQSTKIHFSLSKQDFVQLTIYDILGKNIKILSARRFPAGQHTFNWDGLDSRGNPVASGVYFCELESTGAQQIVRMVLLK